MGNKQLLYKIKCYFSKLFQKFGEVFGSIADKLDPTGNRITEYSPRSFDNNGLLLKENISPCINTGDRTKKRFPQWVKKLIVILGLIIFVFILFEVISILYTEVLYPKQTAREHEALVQCAHSDITKADSIARVLFKFEQVGQRRHHSSFYDFVRDEYGICQFDHINSGIDILKNAAEKGDPNAQFTLGCYYAGADYRTGAEKNAWGARTMDGNDLNFERSAFWYLQAAEQGHGTAMNNLAYCFKSGQGVEKDLRKYLKWLQKSAENGNRYGLLNLGDVYRDGLEVECGSHKEYTGYHYDFDYEGAHKIKEYKTVTDYETLISPDIEKAKSYWSLSAEKGLKEARERLEKIY